MAKRIKPQPTKNTIIPSSSNSVQANLNIMSIQEDACKGLLSDMYDDAQSRIFVKWPNSVGTFLLGAGISGIFQWINNNLKGIEEIKLGKVWEDLWLYLIFVVLGLVFLTGGYFYNRRRIRTGKQQVVDKYFESEKWMFVSQPQPLTLGNVIKTKPKTPNEEENEPEDK